MEHNDKLRRLMTVLLLTAWTAVLAQTSAAHWGDQGDGTFRNPILRADYSDPDPLRVGDDYYMAASTFESYPGVTILHSKDLVNWQTIGAAFTHLDEVSPDYTWQRMRRYNGGVYAPTLSYHDGRYYIFANLYTDGFYMATATDPAGPWQEHMMTDREGRPLRVLHWTDPCPLWDDDGRAYLATSHPGSKYWYSYLFQMSPDGQQLLDADSAYLAQQNTLYEYEKGGGTCISPYHSSEGNRLFKRDGYYYLQHIEFLNAGNGEGTYILRARNIYGDGGSPGHPGKYELHAVERVKDRKGQRLPGQGGYVTTPDGRWWFIGQFNRNDPEGRVPYLVPVRWEDGWPVMDSVPARMAKPIVSEKGRVKSEKLATAICLPQGSDDFSLPTLDIRWRWNHSPRDSHWSLTERRGWLRLKAFRPLGGDLQSSTCGFFQAGNTLLQHAMPSDSTVIETRLDVSRMAEGQRAGLTVFNGGESYALIGMKDGRLYFDADGTIVEGPTLSKYNKIVRLRVYINRYGQARFAYSLKGHRSQWFLRPEGSKRPEVERSIGPATYQLTAGNFRGAQVGLFSYNTKADAGIADFDYLHYTVTNK